MSALLRCVLCQRSVQCPRDLEPRMPHAMSQVLLKCVGCYRNRVLLRKVFTALKTLNLRMKTLNLSRFKVQQRKDIDGYFHISEYQASHNGEYEWQRFLHMDLVSHDKWDLKPENPKQTRIVVCQGGTFDQIVCMYSDDSPSVQLRIREEFDGVVDDFEWETNDRFRHDVPCNAVLRSLQKWLEQVCMIFSIEMKIDVRDAREVAAAVAREGFSLRHLRQREEGATVLGVLGSRLKCLKPERHNPY